jgi:hypothetical protein
LSHKKFHLFDFGVLVQPGAIGMKLSQPAGQYYLIFPNLLPYVYVL